jgi:hypothetical protein
LTLKSSARPANACMRGPTTHAREKRPKRRRSPGRA